MSIRNKVTLIGRTGKEVETKTFDNGGMIATVSLATTEHYTNSQGEKVEETQWHNIVANGKLAEIMQKYVVKGQELAVEGKLTYRSYESNGEKKFVTEIRITELVMLSKPS
jgi:single-strand DNA-binding protein